MRLCSAAILLALATGCGNAKPVLVDFSTAERDYRATDYESVYKRWTRHERVVHEVEYALDMWATFRTSDFRQAFVARYAERYALSDEDRARLLQGQMEAARGSYEFLATAQSANYRWNDLEKKNSVWRVTLLDALGNTLSPQSIRVEKLPEMFELEFYPVKTPFTKTYLIHFDTPAEPVGFEGEKTGRVILRVAGPWGQADFVWQAR
jgi:hypothetical protein